MDTKDVQVCTQKERFYNNCTQCAVHIVHCTAHGKRDLTITVHIERWLCTLKEIFYGQSNFPRNSSPILHSELSGRFHCSAIALFHICSSIAHWKKMMTNSIFLPHPSQNITSNFRSTFGFDFYLISWPWWCGAWIDSCTKCEKWILDDDGDEYNDHDYNWWKWWSWLNWWK